MARFVRGTMDIKIRPKQFVIQARPFHAEDQLAAAAGAAACSSVGAGASGSATGCSVTTLPSFAVIVSSFMAARDSPLLLLQHECCENLGWDVTGIARQFGWEARDNLDCWSVSQRH